MYVETVLIHEITVFSGFYYNSKKLSLYGFVFVHSLICRFYILGVLYTKVFNI